MAIFIPLSIKVQTELESLCSNESEKIDEPKKKKLKI
jgi:hypothetical protein